MSRSNFCGLINPLVFVNPNLAKMIVVKKFPILNNLRRQIFLLGCPNATFGPFAPKPYIRNVWHRCPNATFGPFAPKPNICNVWHHCPNATFGQFSPKPYICNVWHRCPNATFGQFAPKPYICNVWHPLELL